MSLNDMIDDPVKRVQDKLIKATANLLSAIARGDEFAEHYYSGMVHAYKNILVVLINTP